jgi:hypothetical protein
MAPARLATLEELVGHPLEAGKDYRITLPSEVQSALQAGYTLLETFEGPGGVSIVLLGRTTPVGEDPN